MDCELGRLPRNLDADELLFSGKFNMDDEVVGQTDV